MTLNIWSIILPAIVIGFFLAAVYSTFKHQQIKDTIAEFRDWLKESITGWRQNHE